MTETNFRIGKVHISPTRNIMSAEGEEISLEPRIMDVLCALAKNAPDVVSRDHIITDIWNIQYGGDESLTRAVSILRKSFKTLGLSDVVIETIPKRGYRLIPQTHPVTSRTPSDIPLVPNTEPRKRNQSSVKRALFGLVFVSLVGVSLIGVGLMKLNAGPDDVPLSSDVLEAMEKQGDLTSDQATELENMLSADRPHPGKSTLQKAVNDDDKARILAMADMMDPSSFVEGLDKLEAMASTYDDWKFIAEVSISKDPHRAVRAVKQAILIDASEFRMLVLHAQALAASDRVLEARKAIEGLRRVASTNLDKMTAEYANLSVAFYTEDRAEIRAAYRDFMAALEKYEEIYETRLLETPFELKDIDYDPTWVLAASNQTRAIGEFELQNYEAVIESLTKSSKYFLAIKDRVGRDHHSNILLRIAKNNETLAASYAKLENYRAAFDIHENSLKIFDEVDEIGQKNSDIRRPDTCLELAKLAEAQKDFRKSIEAYETAIREYENLLESQPGHTAAFNQLTTAREGLELVKQVHQK